VVPARDEAANLGRLLPSLAGTDADVVVVDDGSSDGTAEVARAHGAVVVDPGPPPEGWTGKAWACAAGAASVTTADRLVFLDADVVVEPGGLDRILAAHDQAGGLLSVQPWHAVERPYEQLSAFFNLIAMQSIDAFTPLGRRVRPSGAFGPCLVVDRADYEAFGGHGHPTVRGAVLDDVALSRRAERATVLGGRGTLRFRMYPHGPAQLLEGWTKNFAGGAKGTRPLTLVLVVVWVTGLLAAPSFPPVYAAYALQLAVLFRRVGRFNPLTALLYPIALAFFLAVFVRSLVLTFVRREVRWRGRTIRT
jgi:4,4'-diaponeurosporenoate glycosyltransferase